jgi:DNA-binding beta-propeller fold protein YncE
VFKRDGTLLDVWGKAGKEEGELSYPYDLAFAPDFKYLYVVEYGNSRVQKFTPQGKSLGCWGGPGRGPGRLASPWALAVDSRGRVHVLDSENDRVQRLAF